MKNIVVIFCTMFYINANAQQPPMKSLLNGKDLKGWYSFLQSKGKNNDPDNVFKMENGVLHISGKEFGYICTEKEFDNFHLAVEFKWGIKSIHQEMQTPQKETMEFVIMCQWMQKTQCGQSQLNARYRKAT